MKKFLWLLSNKPLVSLEESFRIYNLSLSDEGGGKKIYQFLSYSEIILIEAGRFIIYGVHKGGRSS